ncbi:FHA domain-containing protein [bacterium]|nr:FHA domain-containing protein [bacterium]
MIFKRFLYTAAALFIGLALGILVAPTIITRSGWPHTFGNIFLISLPCGLLAAVIAHFITVHIYSDLNKISEAEKQQMQRRWAWLKPAGLALRSPYPINKSQVIIGRDIKCDVLLLNDSISRRHAEIVREGPRWRIRDLGSSNGTFINGQHITDALLNEGDLITLGDINLTFEGPSEPLPDSMVEADISFPTDPEAVLDFDATQVQQFNPQGMGTGTQSMQRTEVMTSGTKIC